MPQQLVSGAERGLEPGLVAVVDQEHVLRVARDQRRLVGRERGTEWRDDFLDAGDDEPDEVEVSLDQQHAIGLPDRIARPVQAVQHPALGESDRLR